MNAFDVVIGPRTRLAQALLADEANSPHRLLVARHDADAAALAVSNPNSDIRLISDVRETADTLPDRVRLLVCALGPVQGDDAPDLARHAAGANRDLALAAAIVNRSPNAQTDIVYVSSVLALAPKPRPEREYYTAWKQLIETRLAAAGGSTMSVYYPGRLVDADSASAAHKAVHTTYSKLAATIAADRAGTRAAVGRDARLWLLKRGILAKSGIHPSAASPGSEEISEALAEPAPER